MLLLAKMNIATGWTFPLLTEGAVAVSGAMPGRLGSGAASAVVLVTASYVSCGVVGMAVPRLRLSRPNYGGGF
jgi:hypothetical protein